MVSVQLSTIAWNVQCTQVSQFLRLGCVLYVTALEAYWCTGASTALLLSLTQYSELDQLSSTLPMGYCPKMGYIVMIIHFCSNLTHFGQHNPILILCCNDPPVGPNDPLIFTVILLYNTLKAELIKKTFASEQRMLE